MITAGVAVGLMGCDVQSVTYTDSDGNVQSCTVAGPGNTDELLMAHCPGAVIDRLSIENEHYAMCGKPMCGAP